MQTQMVSAEAESQRSQTRRAQQSTHLWIDIDCLAVALVLEQDPGLAIGDDLAISASKMSRSGKQIE
jgi:hypothetical protein